jgi:hypothetical protein
MKIGCLWVALGVVGIVLFKLFVVNPAFQKLPNGNYGELYGPVSWLRIPVYVLLLAVILFGVILLFKNIVNKA